MQSDLEEEVQEIILMDNIPLSYYVDEKLQWETWLQERGELLE